MYVLFLENKEDLATWVQYNEAVSNPLADHERGFDITRQVVLVASSRFLRCTGMSCSSGW